MRSILSIGKAIAIRSDADGALSSSSIIRAARYLLPLDEKAATRLAEAYRRALHIDPAWGGGSLAEATALLAEAKHSAIRLNLPESVRDFIALAGGIDAKLTRPVEAAEPVVIERAPVSALPATMKKSEMMALAERLFGQASILARLRRLGFQLASRSGKRPSPQAVLFLAGPPATGKTLTASLLAEALGGDWRTLLIDMARLQSDDTSGAWLVGLRQPYSGAGPGQLTEAVRQHRRTVVVFDNFHAAHPRVQDALLPLFDTGFLRDDYTQKDVDFRETIVVFTSNLGAELYRRPDFLAMLREDPGAADLAFLEAVANETTLRNGNAMPAVSSELLSRLARSTILLYPPLGFVALLDIARKAASEEATRIASIIGCRIEPPDDALLKAQLLSLAPQVDARRAASALPRNLFSTLEDALLDAETPPAEVRFALSDPVRTALSRWANDAGLDELRRKQRGMRLVAQLAQADAVLTANWEGGEIRKVARAADFDGPGAIRIEVPNLSFDRIAGHDRIKQRLQEVAHLLRQPDALQHYGTYPSRGMLLYGRPGTGKTMMAKAFANYCDLPFIATTGSELLNVAFLRHLFKRAREYAPAIVFVDEIDALGRRDMTGYTEPINELLSAIDGFDTKASAHLFVVAATNYPQRVDPALLRAGRIDMHVELPAPDRGARAFFVDQIIARVQGECERERLLDITAGMTGAELEKVKREAALLSLREHPLELIGGAAPMNEKHVIEAIYLVKYGERYARSLRPEREQLAYHEAGHAVCTAVLNPDQRIEQVSIIARGDAAGFVSYIHDEEMPRLTVREVREAIAVRLAGRVSQVIASNGEEGIEAGAESDLQSATELCRLAIAHWGMDEEFGMVHFAAIANSSDPQVTALLHTRIRAWLNAGRELAEEVLRKHWEQVEDVATALLREEVLDGRLVMKMVVSKD